MPAVRPVPQPFDHPIRLGALISGSGTTVANLVQKIADGKLQAEIPLVIANRDCSGIEKARQAGLSVEVVPKTQFADIEAFSDAIFDRLRSANVDLVVLAGFLSMIRIPDDFQFRVMNIHPALIPSFCGAGCYGRHVHSAVLKRGAKVSGCTVHFADQEYDHGPIIVQQSVPVLEGDTAETLAARVFEAECEAYPRAIELFSTGRLEITEENTVRVLDR